jgi:hypothetical protein
VKSLEREVLAAVRVGNKFAREVIQKYGCQLPDEDEMRRKLFPIN